MTDSVIDPRVFRDTLGHYASGITIIAGRDADGPIGFTCQSFYSVSVDPPLVSFSVKTDSTTYPRIRATGRFAVSVLSREQRSVAEQFSRRGTDKWAGIRWHPTMSGNPVIDGTLVWMDCRIWAEHEAGDHFIVIGRVDEFVSADERRHEPLLFFKGGYRDLSVPEPDQG